MEQNSDRFTYLNITACVLGSRDISICSYASLMKMDHPNAIQDWHYAILQDLRH